MSGILAHEFARRGEEVRVVTTTTEECTEAFPFEVIRRPGAAELVRLVRWCDVFFHNNISLQTAWPLLFVRKPWVVAHHSWMRRGDGSVGIRDRLKMCVLRQARNIAVSSALAEGIGVPSTIIANPYRQDVFSDRGAVRDRDVVFLGRFTPDKGAHVLASALRLCSERGRRLSATFIGSGPQEEQLRSMTAGLNVEFAGVCSRAEVAAILNRHKILAVPSTIEEPFGIAAIEGIACGCMVLGSAAGGLPSAIGPCGETFPKGDAHSLSALLEKDWNTGDYLRYAPAHLAKHTAPVVADAYLRVLQEAAAC